MEEDAPFVPPATKKPRKKSDAPRKGRAIDTCRPCRKRKSACNRTLDPTGRSCDTCFRSPGPIPCRPAITESHFDPRIWAPHPSMSDHEEALYAAFREIERRVGLLKGKADDILRCFLPPAPAPVAPVPFSPELAQPSPPPSLASSAQSSRSGSFIGLPITPRIDEEDDAGDASDTTLIVDPSPPFPTYFDQTHARYSSAPASIAVKQHQKTAAPTVNSFKLTNYHYAAPAPAFVPRAAGRKPYDMSSGLSWAPATPALPSIASHMAVSHTSVDAQWQPYHPQAPADMAAWSQQSYMQEQPVAALPLDYSNMTPGAFLPSMPY